MMLVECGFHCNVKSFSEKDTFITEGWKQKQIILVVNIFRSVVKNTDSQVT